MQRNGVPRIPTARLLLGCLLLVLAARPARERLAHAQPATRDLGAGAPEMWRAFAPLVVAFGDGDASAAVAYLRAASSILRKLDAHLERDRVTESFRKQSLASLEDFDLKGFHRSLPTPQPDGFRAFSFEGEAAQDAYRVRAGLKQPPGTPRAFGASYGLVRMRPSGSDDEDRYLLQLRGGAGLGALRWQSLLAGVVDAGGLLEPAEDLPIALRAAEAFLRKRQPDLGAVDRRVLALFWGSFPAASDVVLPISYTHDVVVEDRVPALAKFNLVTRWDLEGMGRKYPELAAFFRDLGELADARLRVSDGAGNALASLHADTKHMQSRVGAVLKEGKVVAVRKGAPSHEAEGALSAARFERMRVTSDLHFVLHRLHVAIENLQIELQYREHADGFELQAKAVGKPRVRVTGAAFGLLPTRVLDWFIPGDSEGLARRMLEVAMAGNHGRGMRLGLRFRETPAGTTLDWDFETELLDSALVRFCMKVISDSAIPSPAQEADIRRLAIDYRNAFDADLERFAKFGARPRSHD
jgi:hypothetical protein